MGLETATLIHQLDASNPVGGSDPKSQGDDHIRLIKATIQNTFPNIEQVVSASHSELNILDGATLSTAELNFVDGVTSAIQTQLNSKPTFSGILDAAGYSPGAVAGANCSISANLQHVYSRVGNVVTVSGRTGLNVTGGGSVLTSFSVPLPVPSDFTLVADLHGTGTGSTNNASKAYAYADTANNRAIIEFYSTVAGVQDVTYTFQYLVK